jgi:hypothetical protein
VTTGSLAANISLDGALINALTTRFASWQEYRIVQAEAQVRCFSSTNPGLIKIWFQSNQNTATPTNTLALNARGLVFPASDVGKLHRLIYRPLDPLEQQWQVLGTGTRIGNFKIYSDNASYGASIVATQYLVVEFLLTVEFRGFL